MREKKIQRHITLAFRFTWNWREMHTKTRGNIFTFLVCLFVFLILPFFYTHVRYSSPLFSCFSTFISSYSSHSQTLWLFDKNIYIYNATWFYTRRKNYVNTIQTMCILQTVNCWTARQLCTSTRSAWFDISSFNSSWKCFVLEDLDFLYIQPPTVASFYGSTTSISDYFTRTLFIICIIYYSIPYICNTCLFYCCFL